MVEESKDTPSDPSDSVNGAAEGIRTLEAQRPLDNNTVACAHEGVIDIETV
jgi:hypothetical protein